MALARLDSELTEDERMLVEAVRDFAREQLGPLDRRCDGDESSVTEVLPQLADMGLLNLCVDEKYNGLGCSHRVYAAILHEVAVWSPSVAVTLSVHNMLGRSLQDHVTGSLRDEPLSCWGSPEHFGAFCLSEADAGSDARATRASAVEADGGYRITGEKMWITNGMHARWLLTLTRLEGMPDDENFCVFLIDGNEQGVERTKIHGKMGIRGSETAVIGLDNVFVPEAHLVGRRGQGLNVLLSTLNEGRIGIAVQATGIAEACLCEMISYARQREQFGRPIGRFQGVADMIAQSAAELEAAKALAWRAAGLIDAGRTDRAASSMAKLYASEAANRIAYRAVQIHGGTGYVNECRAEQLYRDARVTTIYEGTSEIQRLVIARQLANACG